LKNLGKNWTTTKKGVLKPHSLKKMGESNEIEMESDIIFFGRRIIFGRFRRQRARDSIPLVCFVEQHILSNLQLLANGSIAGGVCWRRRTGGDQRARW
jgi:hypothetical protein